MHPSCDSPKKPNMEKENFVELIENDSLPKLDVFIDGKYFTSYLYKDSILRKPVLFPIHTASQERITRGFPLSPNPGERIDHPHHYGLWFNHGVVNDVDYWNSAVIPRKPDVRYGRINHVEFIKIKSGNIGTLQVKKEWRNDLGELILNETTTYIFKGKKNSRSITHVTTLHAPNIDVFFEDSKEGMLALRVRKELEMPTEEPTILLNEKLEPSDSPIVDNNGVTGYYQNSEGVEGYPDVWGKRAKWMQLEGQIKNDSISILIFDHPENLNHPPHWMARDYGLFGVNAFGSNIYTEGKEQFNYTLKKRESVTFKNQIIIMDGETPNHEQIESIYKDFVSKN